MEINRKYAVIQMGARHNYSILRKLSDNNQLRVFVTDYVVTNFDGFLKRKILNLIFREKLKRRNIKINKKIEVIDFPVLFLIREGLAKISERSFLIRKLIRLMRSLSFKIQSMHPFDCVDVVYSSLGEGGDLIRKLKIQGKIVVSEVYIALSSQLIVKEEEKKFPDWVCYKKSEKEISENKYLLENSDIFICPSEFVSEDLIKNFKVDVGKILVNPYPVDSVYFQHVNNPVRGRVLFAGTASLRKGIHYFAKASLMLPDYIDCVVAGGASELVRKHPESERLNYLGHLSTKEMLAQYELADLVVLPSIAEGCAGVICEALAMGIPVVTSVFSGSYVRHGVDGFVMPANDPILLATYITRIIENRGLRRNMAVNAKLRASMFSWEGYINKIENKISQTIVN